MIQKQLGAVACYSLIIPAYPVQALPVGELERWACFAIAGVCDCAPSPEHRFMPGLVSMTSAMKCRVGDFNLASLEAAVVIFMECQGQREVFLLLGLERTCWVW